jgi:hypothetical protein
MPGTSFKEDKVLAQRKRRADREGAARRFRLFGYAFAFFPAKLQPIEVHESGFLVWAVYFRAFPRLEIYADGREA